MRRIKFYNLDISLGNKVTRVLNQVSPKVVIHLAASVEVEESIINPIKYYENNISNSISFSDNFSDIVFLPQ